MANTTNSPSGNVDEHVVKMTFDNKQFEKNAQQSLNTVEKLKSSMNFEATVKGLDKLEDGVAQSNKALDSLNDSVDKIKDRFSNLGIIGVTALQNITNSVINTGKQMIKSLTIAPIQSGFNEYELKMNSMKTIVASTGESVKTVNKYLNDLNKYSDETIYSFSDMTNNIGKFTNAGVKLNDAVNAIKGVSSEAALAGASANEASRAMYNFSQALSAGYVKLIDWKSIENANMATQDFKNNLLMTAEALGTVKKQGDMYVTTTKNMNGKTSQAFNATKNFNDSLAHQWMTNKVLTTTLKAYATDVTTLTTAEKKRYEQELKQQGFNDKQIKSMEALGHRAMQAAKEINTFSKMVDTLQEAVQSSWAATSEYIFGTLDQAKKLWTSLEATIEKVIMYHNNLRNSILSDWSDMGGRSQMLKGFKNLGEALKSIFAPIRQAFLNIFKPFDEAGGLAKKLYNITVQFKEWANSIKLTKEESKDLQTTFQGLFTIFKRVGDVIKFFGKAVGAIIKQLRPVFDILLKIGSVLAEAIRTIDIVVQKIIAAVEYTYDYFIGFEKTAQFFHKIFYTITSAINAALSKVGEALQKLNNETLNNGKTAATVGDVVIKVIRAVYMALLYLIFYGQEVLRAIVIGVGTVVLAVGAGIKAVFGMLKKTSLFKWLENQFVTTAYGAEKNNKKIAKSSKSAAEETKKQWDNLTPGQKFLVVFEVIVSKVKEVVGKAVSFIKSGFNTVKGFFSTFISDVKNYGFGTALLNAIKRIVNGIKNAITTVVNGLKNANIPQPIKNFFSFIGTSIINIKNAIGNFFNFLGSKFPIIKTLQDMLKGVKKVFDEIFGVTDAKGAEKGGLGKVNKDTDKAKDKFSGLKKIGEAFANTFHRVADAIRDFTSSLSASKVVAFALSVMLISMLSAITRLIWYIGSATNVIARSLLPNISGLTSSLNTFVKGINAKFFPTQKTFVLKIREMAEAVAILAGSVVILSTIDSNKLWPAVGAVMALLASMTGLTVILMKFSKATSPEALASFKTAIASFIAIAAAIASIAVALKTMDSITDTDNLWKKLGAFLLGFAGFVATVTVAQKFWGKGMSLGNTVGILFFALSLKKIAKAIVFIADIDFTKIQKGLKGFGVCVGLLAALAIAFGRSKWHSGMNAVGFAITLWLLIIPIKKLAQVDYSNITKALNDCQGMIITLAVIAGSLMAIGMITSKGRSAIHATSAFLKSLGTVLLEITIAIGIMGTMKKSTLKKGITAVGFIMAFITASLGLLALGTKGVKVESSFKTIMGITLGVASLIGAVIVLGLVDTGILAKGTLVVGALLTFFGVCLKLSSGVKDVKMGPILAIMGSIIMLGLLIAILGTMPFGKMMQGILGMGAVVLALELLFRIMFGMSATFMGNVQFKSLILASITTLIAVAGAIGILTAVCNKYGIKNMITTCAGLSGVMLALAATFAIITPAAAAGGTATALLPFVLAGILAVSLITLATFGLMELIGGMVNYIPSAKKNLKGFVDFMGTIGEGIGAVAAGFKKQINNEKLRYLKEQTKTLTDYLQSVADFDPEIIRAANGTLRAAAELIEAGGNTGFNNLGTFDFDSFGEILTQIANAIKSFKTATEDLDISDDDVNIFSTALSAFSKIVAASKGFKEKDINNLSEMLGVINGTGINSEDYSKASVGSGGFARTFSQTVKILREAKITKDDTELLSTFITMLGDIAAVANTIPNSSGYGVMGASVMSMFSGDNRLDDFLLMIAGSDGKPGLGETLSKAVKAMSSKDVNKGNVNKLKWGISALAEVASMNAEIPNSGGVLSAILGNNDLGPFLQAVAGDEDNKGGLGDALKSAISAMNGKSITEKNVDKLKNGVKALVAVAEIKADLGDSSHPIIEWMENILNNKDTFTSFLESLPDMGTNLAKACTSFAGVAPENVAKMFNSMRALATMMQGVLIKDSSGGQSIANIKEFSKNLAKSTTDFQTFSDNLDSLDLQGMKGFADTIYYICNKLKDSSSMSKDMIMLGAKLSQLGTSMQALSSVSLNWGEANTIANGLDKTSTDIVANRANSKAKDVQDLIQSIKDIGAAAKEVDTKSIGHMSNVMKYFSDMAETVKTSLNGASKAITNKKKDFYTKGENLIGSIISGMASKNKALQNKVESLCTICKNTFSNKGKPKFKESGINLLKGLIEGLDDTKTIEQLKKKAKSVAATVVDSTNEGLDEHSPSKKSRKSGVYFLLGMKEGLEDRSSMNKIKKASKSIGDAVDGGVRKRLQIHSPSKVAAKTGWNYLSGFIKGFSGNKAISALTKGAQQVANVLNGTLLKKLDPKKEIDKYMKAFDVKMPDFTKGLKEFVSKSTGINWKKANNNYISAINKAGEVSVIGNASNGLSDMNLETGDGKNSKGTKGSKGSKGSKKKGNSLGKALAKSSGMSEDDIQKVLNAYSKVFYKITPKLDKFNKKYVKKNGHITANYVAHSFESALSRRASVYFSKNLAAIVNKEFDKYAKKHHLKKNTKEYFTSLAKFTNKYMAETQKEINRLYTRVKTIGGKKGLQLVKDSPDTIAKYVKAFVPAGEKFASIVKKGQKTFNTSKSNMSTGIQSLGDYLWKNSDEGKENRKNLKAALKEEEKYRTKMWAEKKKIDQTETKEYYQSLKKAESKKNTDKKEMTSAEKKVLINSKSYKQAKKEYNAEIARAKKKYKNNSKEQKIAIANAKKHLGYAKKEALNDNKSYKSKRKDYRESRKEFNKLNNQRSTSAKKLSEIESKREETHKKINDYIKNEAKGANKAIKDYKKNLKSVLQDYVKLTASNFTNPLTPFEQAQYSDTEKNFKSGKAAKKSIAYTYTQIQMYKNWQADKEWLESGASGLSDSIVKYFKDAGYEAHDELHKLRFATQDEIKELNGYWEDMDKIKMKDYLQKAEEKFKSVEDYGNNLQKLIDRHVLSPEAIKDLVDQGMDGSELLNALTKASDEDLLSYEKLFEKSGIGSESSNGWISKQVESIMTSIGYAWSPKYKKFVKEKREEIDKDVEDGAKEAGGIAGEVFIQALLDYLKDNGMGQKGLNHIKKVFQPLASMIFGSFDDFVKAAEKLNLDKVFGKGTLKKLKAFKAIFDGIANVMTDIADGVTLNGDNLVDAMINGFKAMGFSDKGIKHLEKILKPLRSEEFANKDEFITKYNSIIKDSKISPNTYKKSNELAKIFSDSDYWFKNASIPANTSANTSESSKSDEKANAKISGQAVVNALHSYFQSQGMGNKGLAHVDKALSTIASQDYDSVDAAVKAINNLGLDKEFTRKTMTSLSKGIDYLGTISDSLVTSSSINNNPKGNSTTTTTTKASTTASDTKSTATTTQDNTISGAKTVASETSKTATNVAVTPENATQLKDTILTGLLDPESLKAALHPVIDTSDLYTKVADIDIQVTKQLQIANQKLDRLHTDNAHMHHTMNNMRTDMSNIKSEIGRLNGSMSKMQIKLDTGTLVGALTPGIDKALGKRTSRR